MRGIPLPLWERVDQSRKVRLRRVRGSLHPRIPLTRTQTPHPALRATFSRKGRTEEAQFVFATLGGAAVVRDDVASSMAGPHGVGMVMRKGTMMRVPAIGTKAISIRRSVARYLMTGRSGM